MSLILSWLILTVAVWIAATILPGVHVRDFRSAILVAAIFGTLNFLLGWLLFGILAIATLGIGVLLAAVTRWVVDAILLAATAAITDRFRIDGFRWALVAALAISILSAVGDWIVRALT